MTWYPNKLHPLSLRKTKKCSRPRRQQLIREGRGCGIEVIAKRVVIINGKAIFPGRRFQVKRPPEEKNEMIHIWTQDKWIEVDPIDFKFT
jgi:hypothetical protein